MNRCKMKYLFTHISFFLLLIQCHCCPEQKDNNLLDYNWVMSKNHPFFKLKNDSTTVPYSLFLETVGEKRGALGFTIPIFQKRKNRLEVLIKIN